MRPRLSATLLATYLVSCVASPEIEGSASSNGVKDELARVPDALLFWLGTASLVTHTELLSAASEGEAWGRHGEGSAWIEAASGYLLGEVPGSRVRNLMRNEVLHDIRDAADLRPFEHDVFTLSTLQMLIMQSARIELWPGVPSPPDLHAYLEMSPRFIRRLRQLERRRGYSRPWRLWMTLWNTHHHVLPPLHQAASDNARRRIEQPGFGRANPSNRSSAAAEWLSHSRAIASWGAEKLRSESIYYRQASPRRRPSLADDGTCLCLQGSTLSSRIMLGDLLHDAKLPDGIRGTIVQQGDNFLNDRERSLERGVSHSVLWMLCIDECNRQLTTARLSHGCG